MEKWAKILFCIVGVSGALTFFSLYMLETTVFRWQSSQDFILTSNPYGIMLMVFGFILVLTCMGGGLYAAATDEEGGY